MKERTKRIVLSRYWVGDTIYHKAENSKGFVMNVQFQTDALLPSYFCIFNDREGEWCQEMELSDEPNFSDLSGAEKVGS